MSTSDDSESTGMLGKVTSAAAGLVDQSGEKIAQVVDMVTDAVDLGTRGMASAVTATADAAVFGTLSKAIDVGRVVGTKAGEALGGSRSRGDDS